MSSSPSHPHHLPSQALHVLGKFSWKGGQENRGPATRAQWRIWPCWKMVNVDEVTLCFDEDFMILVLGG